MSRRSRLAQSFVHRPRGGRGRGAATYDDPHPYFAAQTPAPAPGPDPEALAAALAAASPDPDEYLYAFTPADDEQQGLGNEVVESDEDEEIEEDDPLEDVVYEQDVDNINYEEERPVSEDDLAIAGDVSEDEASQASTAQTTAPTTATTQTAAQAMPPPSRPSPFPNDTSEPLDQTDGCTISDMSDAAFMMAIWVRSAGISRRDYSVLRTIIATQAPGSELDTLPYTIDTLKLHLKAVMPNIELRYKKIPLKPANQPTLSAAKKKKANKKAAKRKATDVDASIATVPAEETMYYFNPVDLFTRLMASDVKEKIHQGMGHFTDIGHELYQSRAWTSSIRTTSGQFAYYPGTAAPRTYSKLPARRDAPAYDNRKKSGPKSKEPALKRKKAASAPKRARVSVDIDGDVDMDQDVDGEGGEDDDDEDDPMPSPAVDWAQFLGVKGGPVFPSDFVYFSCHDPDCDCLSVSGRRMKVHSGRVKDVGFDKRTERNERHDVPAGEAVVVRVQSISDYNDLPSATKLQLGKDILHNEMFLWDDEDFYVLPTDLEPFRGTIGMHYAYKSRVTATATLLDQTDHVIRRIVSGTNDPSIRPISRMHPIRGELEIMHFGRDHLLTMFDNTKYNVVSLPLTNFLDAFGLYRNMYRALMGVYFMPAGLSAVERNRTQNVIPLTLGPHGSNMRDVVNTIGPSLRALDEGIVLEDSALQTETDERPVMFCASIIQYIGDQPQQQANAGMSGPRALVSCLRCFTAIENRGDLDINLLRHGRYHWENERLRQFMESDSLRSKDGDAEKSYKKRFAWGKQYGMLADRPPLQMLSPAQDGIMFFPADGAHSELNGITNMAYGLLYDKILTTPAQLEFGRELRRFVFPPGWQRLQSIVHYLGSYSLSEFARLSIVGACLLRVWLRDEHLQPQFRKAIRLRTNMKIELLTLQQAYDPPLAPGDVPSSALIARFFATIARSNTLFLSSKITLPQRDEFMNDSGSMRRLFQELLEAGAVVADKGKGKNNAMLSQNVSQAGSRRSSRIASRDASPARSTQQAEDGEEEADVAPMAELPGTIPHTKQAIKLRRMLARPNVHIGVHYLDVIEWYGTPANSQVFVWEAFHKLMKQYILLTNHNNPERDLLLRRGLEMSLRLLIENGFRRDHAEMTAWIKQIQVLNPKIFDKLLPRSERLQLQQEEKLDGAVEIDARPSTCFTDIATGEQIASYQARQFLNLPVTFADVMSNSRLVTPFRKAFEVAYRRDYRLDPYSEIGRDGKLRWSKRFAFEDTVSQRRLVIRRGDFVHYHQDKIARVDEVFTHQPWKGSKSRRLFLKITPAIDVGFRDPVTQLPIYKIGGESEGEKDVVGLPALRGQKVYMVPVKYSEGRMRRAVHMEHGLRAGTGLRYGDTMLFVDYDIQYL